MTLASAQETLQSLVGSRGHQQTLSNFRLTCDICGQQHFSCDHSQFLESMPQDSVDLVEALLHKDGGCQQLPFAHS